MVTHWDFKIYFGLTRWLGCGTVESDPSSNPTAFSGKQKLTEFGPQGGLLTLFKMGNSRPLFLYFRLFYLIYNWQIKLCWCWDLNRGTLVFVASTLPTEPPPLPQGLSTILDGFLVAIRVIWSLLMGTKVVEPKLFFPDCTAPFEASFVTDAATDATVTTIAQGNRGNQD